MPITRPGETPFFYEYAVKYALKSSKEDLPESVSDFDPNQISIPPYQRRIVWKEQEIKDFLESKSILFGSVILAAPSGQDELLTLLDGLQRFATATAMLHYLYPKVLAPDSSRKDIQKYFKRVAAEVGPKQPIIDHNHKLLKESIIRTGITSSYNDLCESVNSIINEELQKPEEFAKKITKTFVNNQIAIDKYYGFKNEHELIQTFININSAGIRLTEVDLLRSEIIQQAASLKWSEDEIISVENDFTDTFQSKEMLVVKVLGKHLYNALEKDPTKVFKNWEKLTKENVEKLLQFIEQIYKASKKEDRDGNLSNPYLYEIVECGAIPFTITTWYFYKKMQEESKTPTDLDDEFYSKEDLCVLLRMFYRHVVGGSISRIGQTAAHIIQTKDFESVEDIAEILNRPEMGDLLSPDKDWIKTGLRKAKIDRVKRIFNACLLPDRGRKGEFFPLRYGNKNDEWNVDHLIPKITKQKNQEGGTEFDHIVNLSPLQSHLNKNIKDNPCSIKIGPNGIYNHQPPKHPYVKWLTNEHYEKYKTKNTQNKNELDLQEMLAGSVGDERLDKMVELLKSRI